MQVQLLCGALHSRGIGSGATRSEAPSPRADRSFPRHAKVVDKGRGMACEQFVTLPGRERSRIGFSTPMTQFVPAQKASFPTALAKGGLAALGSGAEVGGGGLHFTVVFSGERSRHQEGSPRSLHLGRVPALCGPNCVGGIQASSASILGERKYARSEK